MSALNPSPFGWPSLSIWLPITAVADDVPVVSVIAWVTIHVGVLPWVCPDVLLQVRTLPVFDAIRFFTQRFQPLLCRWKDASVELV
jgi:hypothetical protein